jgi:hypothetical protein
MKNPIIRILIAVVLMAATGLIQAQSFTGHYKPGVEGIKAATLPPPGLYFRDYNYFYFASDYPGGPPDFSVFAYAQLARPIWISGYKLLGGYYGADILFPFAYQDVEVGDFTDSRFGLGDVFIEPITLSWHLDKFDFAVAYGFYVPTGEYDASPVLHSGQGYWTHMLTAGATWYIDPEKTWVASALNRYEINHENSDWDITPGHVWTLEFGVSKAVRKTIDVGLIGYYQAQTTRDSGSGADEGKDHVLALGPEINTFCPKLKLFGSLRWAYEFEAHDRPEGNTITLTLTKIF